MDLKNWIETADESALLSGVGCPACKHDGAYWVKACRLHALIGERLEDLAIARVLNHDAGKILDEIREIAACDPEDDLVGRVRSAFDMANELEAGED